MNGNRDFKDLLRAFSRGRVRYLIVGAYAVIHYTEPRYTKDIDLWVDPSPENARRVFQALERYGAPLDGVTEQDFANPRIVYQIGIEPNRVDLIMGLTGLRFAKAWENRARGVYDGLRVNVLGLEDLLANKRKVGRPMDELDARALAAVRSRHRKRKRR
jgi:predicted nucleotidyltransferase